MQLLLQACLNVVGTMWIMERPRNSRVGGWGATLIVMPAPFVGLLEAGSLSYFGILLVVGQACFCAVLWFFAIKQEASINTQIELRQQTEQARKELAEAGMAKLQFFAAASHDLRQPVHAIGLYLATLQETALAPAAQRAITGIHQSWKVLDGLLMQILDLARMGNNSLQPHFTALDVNALAHDVAYTFYPSAERKGVRVVVVAPTQAVPHVQADVFMLRRVLSNLLDNAIKFSPTNGRVVLAVRSRAPYWAVDVRDAGVGIAPEHHSKVFDEFVQIDNPDRNRREGFGLGLPVVRAFVQAMGGQVQVQSALGCGTCMRVLLLKAQPNAIGPRVTATTDKHSESIALPPPLAIKYLAQALRFDPGWVARLSACGKHILLVEDDPLVSDAFASVMQLFGLPVLHATLAKDAMAVYGQAAVAVCDMRLPGPTNGLDLAKFLRSQGIPVVVVTGENTASTLKDIRDSGIPLLKKPVEAQVVLDTLSVLLRRRFE